MDPRKTGTPRPPRATGSSPVRRHGLVPFALLRNPRKTGTPRPPRSTGSSPVRRHGLVPFALILGAGSNAHFAGRRNPGFHQRGAAKLADKCFDCRTLKVLAATVRPGCGGIKQDISAQTRLGRHASRERFAAGNCRICRRRLSAGNQLFRKHFLTGFAGLVQFGKL